MSPLAYGLLLLGIALLVAGYVVVCDRFDGVPGPVSTLDQSRPATVARREGVAPAQGLGPCLPRRDPGIASGPTQGNAAQTAHALATASPAGVPGGSGSRGAASSEAA